jgi:CDGSH iron-sulfur domain-containing protein 3
MANFPQLTEEDFQQFNQLLGDLLAKSEASAVLIVEKAGHLIHECGPAGQFETTLVSTLASNAYNATAFMANLIGEAQFSGMYQQGEKFSTLIQNIDEHCLLVVIFRADLSVGAVKYYASTTIPLVARQIEIAQEREPSVSFDLTDLDVTDAAALFRRKEPAAADLDAPAPEPELPSAAPQAEAPVAAPDPEPVAAPSEQVAPESIPPAVEAPSPALEPAGEMIVPPTPPPASAASVEEALAFALGQEVGTKPAEPVVPPEPAEPLVPKKGPYIEAVMPGTYWWCACGRSKSQPFCDGSHEGTGLFPIQVDITQAQKRAFCGCKHTRHPPFCDGTHNKVKI